MTTRFCTFAVRPRAMKRGATTGSGNSSSVSSGTAPAGAEVGRVILPFRNATQAHGAWFGAQDLPLT